MKNTFLHCFFLLLSLGFARNIDAQVLPRRALKIDLVAPTRMGMQVSYAVRQRNDNKFEFQFGYERHRHPEGIRVFNGNWHNRYAQDKFDTLLHPSNIRMGSSDWQYLGDNLPFARVPTFVANETFQLAGLYRISFFNGESHWHFFLQAGASLTLHRYFENREFLALTSFAMESWFFTDQIGLDRRVNYQVQFYEQRRNIRLKNDWRAGVAYQMGVSRRLGKHWFVEGRLDLGMNIGPPPYEDPEAPLLARRLPVKPALLIGRSF